MNFDDLTFLIVDDVLATRRVLKRLLTVLGVPLGQVIESDSAEQALEWLKEEEGTCDIIISDFHLGDLKGLDILEYVRNNPALQFTPFLMMTNDLQREDLYRAKDLGVSSYLLKPLSVDNIAEYVQEAIEAEYRKREMFL